VGTSGRPEGSPAAASNPWGMRRIAAGLILLVAASIVPAGPGAGRHAAAAPPLSIYVIVMDGMHPDDVDELTPNLLEFRRDATWYEQSRSVLIAETIPNHVAMMTGVYPARSGIAANSFWPRTGPLEDVDLSDPKELRADTLFTTLARRCPALRTGAALSKRYLYEIFSAGGRNVAPDDF
jgi:predicted AlkP superfamily pyrophosphatase or phosphodiesterase